MTKTLIILILSIAIAPALLPLVNFIQQHFQLYKNNYQGIRLPACYGLIFIINTIIILLLGYTLKMIKSTQLLPILFLTSAMALLGLLDDIYGTTGYGGFRGHLCQLFLKKKFTTGLSKLLFGGLISLLIGFIIAHGNLPLTLLNALLIALSANALNLLDTRPGRAIKGYLIGLAILLAFQPKIVILLIPTAAAVLIYAPIDFRALGMMGDTGSNVLGASLGFAVATSTLIWLKLLVFLGLAAFHLYTEKYSLTQTIEKVPLLKVIDKLGCK